MKWDNLNLKEKADLMKVYVSNGITNIDDIIAHYDNKVKSYEDWNDKIEEHNGLNIEEANSFAYGGTLENTELKKQSQYSSSKDGYISPIVESAFRNFDIREHLLAEGGTVRKLFEQKTGRPWSEVKYFYPEYDGSAEVNLKIRDRLLKSNTISPSTQTKVSTTPNNLNTTINKTISTTSSTSSTSTSNTSTNTTIPREEKDRVNIVENRKLEQSYSNKDAIMNAKHNGNYAIVDKDSQTIEVYDPSGKLLTTVKTNTGASNLDYNTKTYTTNSGKLINKKGNNSTPGGITEITGISTYHGVPAFQRARVGNDDKYKSVKDENGNLVPDTIASSIHWEKGVSSKNNSNGCVRVNTEGAKTLGRYLTTGSRVYTLPQQEGSRFILRDGNLSYVADDIYGKDKTNAGTVNVNGKTYSKHDWDDYNVTVNRTYQPLVIDVEKTGDKDYDNNVETFKTSLETNKQHLQEALNLSSYEYNTLAMLAMGIAQQESKFATSKKYKLKQSQGLVNLLKKISGNNSFNSTGIAQIKYGGDNEDMRRYYQKAGVTDDHDDIANEAKAVVTRLTHAYKNQYLPKKDIFDAANMTMEEALSFIFNGGNPNNIKKLLEQGQDVHTAKRMTYKNTLGRLLNKRNLEIDYLDYSNKVNKHSSMFGYYGEFAEGGDLNTGNNQIGEEGILDWLKSLFNKENQDVKNTQKSKANDDDYVDIEDLAIKQGWTESKFNSNAVSPAGAIGDYQIMPSVHEDYIKATGDKGGKNGLKDSDYNRKVRDWYIEWLKSRPYLNKPENTNKVFWAKIMASYNAGVGNVLKVLNENKAKGVDIYTTTDWLNDLPKETQDYVNFIVFDKNTGTHRNKAAYEGYKKLSGKNQNKFGNVNFFTYLCTS